jgi:hypothetical protein
VQIHENKNVLFTKADLKKRRLSGKPLSPAYQIINDEPAEACVCGPAKKQTELTF